MKISCQEQYNNALQYAESIHDSSLRACLTRLEQWEQNPNCKCEIELYYDSSPYSFGFTQRYENGKVGIVGGLLYHGSPDHSFAFQIAPFKGWQIHT